MKRKGCWVLIVLLAVFTAACSPDPVELYQKAEAHRKLGETEVAVKEYRKLIKLQPGNAAAYFGLGMALLDQGLKAEGRAGLENAVKLGKPADIVAEAHHRLGDLDFEAGNPAKALEHYRKTGDISKKKILTTRIALVKSLFAAGDSEAGTQEMLNLMREHPDNIEVEALLQDPATEKARSKLRSYFLDMAEKELKRRNFKKTQSLIEKSEGFPGNDPEADFKARWMWAVVRSEQGECETAGRLWADIVSESPEKKAEADFYNIVCSMHSDKALEALKRFEAVAPEDPFHDRAKALIPEALKLIPTRRFKIPLEKAHVRAGPGLKFKIIDKWPLTQEVRVIEKETKNWYRINYKNTRSAFMHKSVITDKPISILIKKNGWEQTQGEGWMLAFQPVVHFKLTNLSTSSIKSIRLKMVIKQGRKTFSKDTFKVEISREKRLKPDTSITGEIAGSAKQELLTRPDEAYVILYASVDEKDFERYREFYLTRKVVDEGG